MRVASGVSEEARAFVFLLCSTCVSHPVNARGIRHFSNYSFNVELALLSRRSNSRSVGIDDVRYTDSDTLCSLNSNRSSRRNFTWFSYASHAEGSTASVSTKICFRQSP